MEVGSSNFQSATLQKIKISGGVASIVRKTRIRFFPIWISVVMVGSYYGGEMRRRQCKLFRGRIWKERVEEVNR